MKIYHNPRCSKSRQTLDIINNKNIDIEIIKYLESTPSKEELKHILTLLNFKPIDLIRKNESIWKSEYKGKALSEADLVKAMIAEPKLIERPILSTSEAAVVGRPIEAAQAFLQNLKQD